MDDATYLGVPPELLAGMAGSMADGVVVARETRAAVEALRIEIATLRTDLNDLGEDVAPAVQTYAEWLRTLTNKEADATANARVAAESRARADSEAAARKRESEQAEAVQRVKDEEISRGKTRVLFWQILAGIGALLVPTISAITNWLMTHGGASGTP